MSFFILITRARLLSIRTAVPTHHKCCDPSLEVTVAHEDSGVLPSLGEPDGPNGTAGRRFLGSHILKPAWGHDSDTENQMNLPND